MQDNASSRDTASEPSTSGDAGRDRQPARSGARAPERIEVDLVGAVVAMQSEEPIVLLGDAEAIRLPTCTFEPSRHETLDSAFQQGVLTRFGIAPGHIEQLVSQCYQNKRDGRKIPALSIGYLALARSDAMAAVPRTATLRIYDVLPWEDWRHGRPACLGEIIVPALLRWLETSNAADDGASISSRERVRIAFGLDDCSWDDERVVERLDLLDSAGLLSRVSSVAVAPNHIRFIAAALGRLRARIRHRPVIFEMLPDQFTLFELQRAVEAILGPHLHKQNFRRLVEGMGLVEPTGDVRSHTGGRPARLFRFRPAVMLERAAPGVRIKAGKAA